MSADNTGPGMRTVTANGAELLTATAVGLGMDTCFANPGTTEMALVAALDAVPGIGPVLGLFEGVCFGAADGYGRITGRPAQDRGIRIGAAQHLHAAVL